MSQEQIGTPSKIPKQTKAEKPKEKQELDIDVDDALIDDKHPKDTIRGGPVDKKI